MVPSLCFICSVTGLRCAILAADLATGPSTKQKTRSFAECAAKQPGAWLTLRNTEFRKHSTFQLDYQADVVQCYGVEKVSEWLSVHLRVLSVNMTVTIVALMLARHHSNVCQGLQSPAHSPSSALLTR